MERQVVEVRRKSPQPPFTKGGSEELVCGLLVGLADGELGALEGALALFE